MKKVEALFAEIMASEELKAKYQEAVENEKVAEFLKENDCDAAFDDWMAYMKGLLGDESMSMDDMDQIAGGAGDIIEGAKSVVDLGDIKSMLLSSVRREVEPKPMMVTMANPFYIKDQQE